MKVLYADGSGNTYIITGGEHKVIEYVPVKPASSSSGVYDGGTYVKKVLSDADYTRIVEAITTALDAPKAHTRDRLMGSGSITIHVGDKERSCILKPGSTEREGIEVLLKSMLD